MKHVFSDEREIAHLWMHQAQDNAHNRQGNFYFSGPTIYSYGSHFPIAKIVKNDSDSKAVLFTTRGYSPTTNRHITIVSRALDPQYPVFRVTNPDRDQRLDYRKRIENEIESVKPRMRQRTKDGILGTVVRLTEEANSFAEFFGYVERLTVPESLEQVAGDLKAARERAAVAAQAEAKKRAAKAAREATIYRKKHADDAEHWRQTGSNAEGDYIRLSMFPTMLRLVNEAVETSIGFVVPIEHAERAYRFVAALRAKRREWQTNGHTFHVGHYRLDSVSKKGDIRAGCHTIEWAEIERLAKEAGWSDKPEVEAEVRALA